ncbi:hypothetical protein DYB31_004943 [Aphanomyces astaci]|uniref:Uncharacterized protein n=2 Tax=Aphanomyces astaci TaxID=112090 RepID=A0A397EJ76_APHAT|nr:hypothetical protein DYB31_004943 [Aphanomyces astaci]
MSNFCAILLILATAGLVLILLKQGMFYSTNMSYYNQDQWISYGQTCRLTYASGFVPNSCSFAEVNVTGAVAWSSVGRQLGADVLVSNQSVVAFVTTCYITGIGRWGTLYLLVGDAEFPQCNPQGSQEVLGMTTLETVGTPEYPDGAFLLSTCSDAIPSRPASVVETNGMVRGVSASISKVFVSASDGWTEVATWDQPNYIATVNSLNRLYLMRVWVVAHCVDMLEAEIQALPGYSIGKTSRKVLSIGWENSHDVDNQAMLIAFQLFMCFTSLALLSNDGLITLEGLSGLLQNKPVLTYDMIASLERRKLLLLEFVGTFLFSPLYVDVLRYTYDIEGHHYWSMSFLMMAVMMALSWMAILTLVQAVPVPSPWRNRPLCYSAPVFIYCTVILFVGVELAKGRGPTQAADFWTYIAPTLELCINGSMWTSGAYVIESDVGITPVIYIVLPDLVVCMVVAWVLSILAHKVLWGRCLLNTAWTSQNAFLNELTTPQWVTSLDLDEANAISIGNKRYCKPSLMVLLGYCTVLDKSGDKVARDVAVSCSSRESSSTVDVGRESHLAAGSLKPPSKPCQETHAQYMVVSIYDLVPTITSWLRHLYQPKVVGTIHQNKFDLCKSTTRVSKPTLYQYSRGDCCG